ncbi:MAG TPA: protein kinase, partial [Thermoanaerobaculia bacterium]|nr:protein kinase [Thermoanaerobaculia bacterium]
MTIKIGSRLGPYEILSAMGAGGMGEVWRARDTRLERDVAVKVLPASFADNAQLRIRFLREAKSISSLNHPNICTLHDVGQEDGVDYLVMELIEGESLAEKLTRGPLPLDQVLRVGSQIATALHAAHRQGIIHRDLKPGNIMLTRSGAKLLDFGLAKNPSSTSGVIVGATGLATEARPLTEEGTILGTFQYMAPEQLEGLEAGPRTDIFALGCVLFEMATGKRAFEGKSRTSLIAAIVSGQPPAISSLVTMSPPALDHVVSRCLAKDPEERWQSAHDVASELQWIGQTGSASATAAHPVPHRRKRERLAWSVAATALLAIVAATAVMLRGPKAAPEVLRASITPSAGMAFDFGWERGSSLVLSPDGRHMLFSTVSSEPNPALWIRSLATGESKKIAGSEGGSSPFWSVDSRFVAFFAGGKLLKADLTGAPPTAVCDAPVGRGGSWNRDGTIIFSPTATSEIFRVSASGGTPQPVTKVNTTAGETTHRWPSFLP